MKDVLITGLGVGIDFGVCEASNMNYVELLQNPEVLLWADKICIPSEDYFRDSVIDKECKMVFSILENEGLIKRYSQKEVDFNAYNAIESFAIRDLKAIASVAPDTIVTSQSSIGEVKSPENGQLYCVPRIASIYAALIVANEINANCLFSSYEEEFIKKRFYNSQDTNQAVQMNKVYKEVLSFCLPNEPILHEYGRYKCSECINSSKCQDTYLVDVEKRLLEYLSLRNTDEMAQLREVIDDIIANRNRLLGAVDAEDVVQDLRYRKNRIEKDLNLRCKAIKRVANIVTCIAAPIAALGKTAGNKEIAGIATLLSGASIMTDKAIQNYESRNNWVNFIDHNKGGCR